jgi:uncharacterized cupin superfamily protein
MITSLWSPQAGAVPQLEEWPAVDSRALASGEGLQSGIRYFHDEAGLSVGIWAATPFTTHLLPYPVHEFMIVHEGTITIEDEDGIAHSFGPGEAFLIPRGFMGRWRQEDRVLKSFVIFEGTEDTIVPGAKLVRVDPAQPLEPLPALPAQVLASKAPTQSRSTLYTDATGRFRLALWQSDAFETVEVPYPYQEAMFILEGALELVEKDAVAGAKAGEHLFVSDGSPVIARTMGDTRKIFVALDKNPA